MTAYEIVMVVLGILGLLIAFGGFVVALLTFLDKSVSKKMPTLSANRMGGAHQGDKPNVRYPLLEWVLSFLFTLIL